MAQGKLKTKVKLPPGAKVKQKQKKQLGLKKGARYIAPKKARHIEAKLIKKSLTKEIGRRIEREIISMASHREMKSLKVLHAPQPSTSKEKK
ncbi:hypothetical protein LSH36_236g01037 [Paralvinella palmiformis]|uniref:Leydig cell tumor 10 kDa protein homolog n=1 Tax=Paralvinella palmiformis TaxID=53620 RepID=A0AAD9N5B8_9ANNE|nr:hypothetical protein LSH36_236g01037 [Paralvinella palmiformis]